MSAKPTKGRSASLLEIVLLRLLKVLRWFVADRQGRFVLLAIVLLMALGIGPHLIWRHIGPRVLSGANYQLLPQHIELQPPPDSVRWIRRDVKAEIVRDASLDRPLLILDDDLAARIYRAVAMHPWVERVHRVQKHHPARVTVDVTYRRPVAMVERPGQGGALLPVDGAGIVLPPEDFSPIEATRYPRIVAISTSPLGVGSRWADSRVIGAASLAALLGDRWRTLNLERIVPSERPDGPPGSDEFAFELWTRWGTRIHWGRAPGSDAAGELSAEEKLARLMHYAEQFGSLDEPGDGHEFDLRQRGEMLIYRRTAQRENDGNGDPRGESNLPDEKR
jgi:hypothetical protein